MSLNVKELNTTRLYIAPADEIIKCCGEHCQKIIDSVIAAKGMCVIALSGGTTPAQLYRHMAQHIPAKVWPKINVVLVDERLVKRGDSDSNEALIDKEIMAGLALDQRPLLLRLNPEMLNADAAAHDYDAQLHGLMGAKPIFDLMLLGLGEDGHTASIFSVEEALIPHQEWVVPAYPAHLPHQRITLTMPVINQAAHIVFLVTGINKALVVAKAFNAQEVMPAKLVKPIDGDVSWFLDEASASQVTL